MEFTIKGTENKIDTIRVLREHLGTGLLEGKNYAEGEPFTFAEYDNRCANLYLDLLATGAIVTTDRPFQEWQFEQAIKDAEWQQYRLSNRILKAKEMLAQTLARK